ncbi:MAG: sensor histidine kinase [Lachnospiraceae bacterium]|nr:sensor histidine kinase [Lachnospiraceae bacterium]MBQ7782073.1 sensor histidine kinase [Lachnospiraceae bacterium]
MHFLFRYIKQRWKVILVFFLCSTVFFVTFGLYHLPLEAVMYPTLLCGLIGIVFAVGDMNRVRRKHKYLQKIKELTAGLMEDLPAPDTIEEADYRTIVGLLCEEQTRLQTCQNARYTDMVDYYTVWAHQIKTPIASMRLQLQNEDSEFARRLTGDLQRIEQYVEMVLAFLRLDSVSSDYVIKEQDLDAVVKPVIKKFSTQFIYNKIKLCYEPLDTKVITDEKWLSFVVEQVLSNALKYTSDGSITIRMEDPKILCIRDTGIGIAAEDLPRIFEKGYTGGNGRRDKKASGIGLYLCKRICHNLGHTISAESSTGVGTTIRIGLSQRKLEIE